MASEVVERRKLFAGGLRDGDAEVLRGIVSGDIRSDDDVARGVFRPYKLNAITRDYHSDTTSQVKCLKSGVGNGTTTAQLMEMIFYYPMLRVIPRVAERGGRLARVRVAIIRETKDQCKEVFEVAFDNIRQPFMTWKPVVDGGKVLWTDTKTGIRVEVEAKYLGLDDKLSANKLLSLQVDITAFSELIGFESAYGCGRNDPRRPGRQH